jgi:hypothetical protein
MEDGRPPPSWAQGRVSLLAPSIAQVQGQHPLINWVVACARTNHVVHCLDVLTAEHGTVVPMKMLSPSPWG